MNQRNIFIDILKGFAIMLVVFGHCIQYGTSSPYLKEDFFFDNQFFKIIYSFHMPMFMLISGFLFNKAVYKNTFCNNIKYRIIILIIPIFMWSLLLFFLKVITLEGGDKSFINNILFFAKMFVNIFLSNIWFLWAIFYCSIFVLIANKLGRDRKILYLSGFIISFLVPDVLGMALYKYMYPFFIIGYFFAIYQEKIKLIIKNRKIKIIIFVLSGVGYIGLMQFFGKNAYIYTSGHFIFNVNNPIMQMKVDIYRTVVGLFGSAFVISGINLIYEKYYIQNKFVWKIIAYIGRNSLGIYIISSCFLNHLLTKIVGKNIHINYINTIIETIIVLMIALISTIIIKRNRVMNMLFLGASCIL